MMFEIEVVEGRAIDVRWSKPFGVVPDLTPAAVLACLLAVPGVVHVDMLRFSGLVTCAPGVTLADVAVALQQALLDDELVAMTLERYLGVDPYSARVLSPK